MRIKYQLSLFLIPIALAGMSACQQSETSSTASAEPVSEKVMPPAAPKASPFILTASIQDLMTDIVDPSADYLWDSVVYIGDANGTEQHQPRTDADWLAVKRKAITLMEATNLLMMPGRRVVAAGEHMQDEGLEGNLTAAQIQKLIDDDPASFAAFAHALNTAAGQSLQAIKKHDVDALLEAGGTLDEACEACHLKYWYPNQGIPQY